VGLGEHEAPGALALGESLVIRARGSCIDDQPCRGPCIAGAATAAARKAVLELSHLLGRWADGFNTLEHSHRKASGGPQERPVRSLSYMSRLPSRP